MVQHIHLVGDFIFLIFNHVFWDEDEYYDNDDDDNNDQWPMTIFFAELKPPNLVEWWN